MFFGILTLACSLWMIVRRHHYRDPSLVILPVSIQWIGLLCQLVLLFPAAVALAEDWGPGYVLCALGLSLPGFFCVLGCANERVRWDEKGFTVYSILNIPRHYSYGEIRFLQGREKSIRIYVRDASFSLPPEARNRDEFLKYARAQCQKANAPIPRTPPADLRLDPFLGHVEESTPMLVSLILAAVLLFVGLPALVISDLSAAPVPMESLHMLTAPAESCTVYRQNMYLQIGEAEYRIPGYPRTLSDQAPLAIPRNRFTLGYTVSLDREDREVRTVHYLMTAQGRVLTTPEAVFRYQHRYDPLHWALLSGVLLCTLLFSAGALVVGRHPERYSPRVRRLFFRPGSLHLEIPTPFD